MSEQVLQNLFEDLNTASREERIRLKQKHYLTLYGSSSRPVKHILEDLHRAGEICDNFRRARFASKDTNNHT